MPKASLAPSPVSRLDWLVTLSDFHCVGVSGPSPCLPLFASLAECDQYIWHPKENFFYRSVPWHWPWGHEALRASFWASRNTKRSQRNKNHQENQKIHRQIKFCCWKIQTKMLRNPKNIEKSKNNVKKSIKSCWEIQWQIQKFPQQIQKMSPTKGVPEIVVTLPSLN